MISTKRAMTIIMEEDKEKRDAMIDKLTEADAKHLLKIALFTMKGKYPQDHTSV